MTDVAIPNQPTTELQTYQQNSIDRLEAWARQAIAVREIAAGIVNTSFVPAAYRGKPDEATAAILAGAELGFDPMASLRAFDNIQGTPAPKAITLRAVAQAAGHTIRIVESDDRHCIVEGQRRGDDQVQRLEWTTDRAQTAGYISKNPNWKTNPAAMLVARATAEMARWIASDAIMGMPYAAEELTDHTGHEARHATARVTAADIVGKAVAHHGGTVLETKPASTMTADVALAEIADAQDLDDLENIRLTLQDIGMRDEKVVTAWRDRQLELGGDAA